MSGLVGIPKHFSSNGIFKQVSYSPFSIKRPEWVQTGRDGVAGYASKKSSQALSTLLWLTVYLAAFFLIHLIHLLNFETWKKILVNQMILKSWRFKKALMESCQDPVV